MVTPVPGQWLRLCWTVPAAWVKGGRWIPYSAQQVALRRAARLVCVFLGLGAPGGLLPGPIGPEFFPLPPPAPAWVGAPGSAALYIPVGGFEEGIGPEGGTELFVPPEEEVGGVPEPSGLLVLPAAGLFFWYRKR